MGKLRRPGASESSDGPLEGLQEAFDGLGSVEAAKVLFAELERDGFDAFAELRKAGRRPSDLYRRLLVPPR